MRYQITPVPKPRQTQSDKWNKRPSVMRYRAFADEVRLSKIVIPESGLHITFVLPMPDSWSKKKQDRMEGEAHQQKPDLDNLIKALLDALFHDDSHIWDFRVTKTWGVEGAIELSYNNPY